MSNLLLLLRCGRTFFARTSSRERPWRHAEQENGESTKWVVHGGTLDPRFNGPWHSQITDHCCWIWQAWDLHGLHHIFFRSALVINWASSPSHSSFAAISTPTWTWWSSNEQKVARWKKRTPSKRKLAKSCHHCFTDVFSCPTFWQNRRLADQPNFGTRKKITVDPEIFEFRCRHGLIQNPMVSIQLAAGCLVFRLTDGFARNALLANQIQLFQPLVEWVLRPEKVALSHFQPLKCCLIHVNPIKMGEVEKTTSFHSSWDMTTKLQFMLWIVVP